jgi:hypothetical protein
MSGLLKIAGELYDKRVHHEQKTEDIFQGHKTYKSQQATDQALHDHRKERRQAHRAIIAKTGLPADFDPHETESKIGKANVMLHNNRKNANKASAAVAGLGAAYGLAVASHKPSLKSYLKGGLGGAAVGGLATKALMSYASKHTQKEHDQLSQQLDKYRSA